MLLLLAAACGEPKVMAGDCTLRPADESWSWSTSSHQAFVDGVLADIEESGACGDGPPEKVVTLDGCKYARGEGMTLDWGYASVLVASYGSGDPSVATRTLDRPDNTSCADVLRPTGESLDPARDLGEDKLFIELHDHVEYPGTPASVVMRGDWTTDNYSDDKYALTTRSPSGPVSAPHALISNGSTGAYGWSCIDEVRPPEGLEDGPAWYNGYMYLHTERWEDRDGVVTLGGVYEGIPLDIYVPLGDVYCGYAENAGEYETNDYYQITDYPDCDGIDNDFDGEIDEGAPDEDGDGVADCLKVE